jgi:hypothetical protein
MRTISNTHAALNRQTGDWAMKMGIAAVFLAILSAVIIAVFPTLKQKEQMKASDLKDGKVAKEAIVRRENAGGKSCKKRDAALQTRVSDTQERMKIPRAKYMNPGKPLEAFKPLMTYSGRDGAMRIDRGRSRPTMRTGHAPAPAFANPSLYPTAGGPVRRNKGTKERFMSRHSAEMARYKEKMGGADGGPSPLERVRAPQDGNFYMVAADLPDKEKAANKLAEIYRREQYLLQSIQESLQLNKRIIASDGVDITDEMKRLVRKHYGKLTPFAEYHNPDDLTVGSNSNKGEMFEASLRDKRDTNKWNSDNTLFRVHTHELAHSADGQYRKDGMDGHGPVFKRLHQHLLGVAENLGIYNCAEYQRSGRKHSGLTLPETYCGK